MLISYGLAAGLTYAETMRLQPGVVMDLFMYRREYDGELHGIKWQKQ